MACLNLKLRGKAWRSFTSKIQTKLQKFHKPKAIMKTRQCRYDHPSSAIIKRRIQKRKKQLMKPSRSLQSRLLGRRFSLHKAPALVYIDKLFKEPVIAPAVGKLQPRQKMLLGEEEGGSSSKEGDRIWESVGMESHQMYGIDQRAEEFIAKFRAEMEHQERLAQGS